MKRGGDGTMGESPVHRFRIDDDIDADAIGQELQRLVLVSPYRHYRLLSPARQLEQRRRQLLDALAAPGRLAASLHVGGQLAGCCVHVPLAWDSAHFGMAMGRLECVLADPVDASAADALLAGVMRRVVAAGTRHVSAAVDTEDLAVAQALGRAGFALLDTRLNYLARALPAPRDEGRYRVRDCLPADLGVVADIVRSLSFPSRFSRDPVLPRDRVEDLYVRWMQRLLERREEGVVIVASRGERLVACAGISPVDLGLPGGEAGLLGNSLLACTREGIGSAWSLVGHGINAGLARAAAIEFATSLGNLPMIRILEAHGCRLAGAVHALRWHADSSTMHRIFQAST